MNQKTTPPSGTLDQWLGPLVHMFTTYGMQKFRSMNLHPGQLPVLQAIASQEGLSLRELAAKLHVTPPTVTVTVQRMEKRGLVRKGADEHDQRISRIYLTEEGHEIVEAVNAQVRQNHDVIMQGFTQEEIDQLREYLKRMTRNLCEACGKEWPNSCKQRNL